MTLPVPPCMDCDHCGLLTTCPLVAAEDDTQRLTAEELAEIRGDDEYHRRVDEGEPLLPSERMAAGLRI